MFDLKIYIGRAIKELRTEKGLTQLELAYEIGANGVDAIKSVEHGGSCSVPKLDLIADVLETRASYIIYVAEELRSETYQATKEQVK